MRKGYRLVKNSLDFPKIRLIQVEKSLGTVCFGLGVLFFGHAIQGIPSSGLDKTHFEFLEYPHSIHAIAGYSGGVNSGEVI